MRRGLRSWPCGSGLGGRYLDLLGEFADFGQVLLHVNCRLGILNVLYNDLEGGEDIKDPQAA